MNGRYSQDLLPYKYPIRLIKRWTENRKGGQKTKDSILSLIASDPFATTNEMSKRLEINRSAISKHIKKLKEDHIIERIGPDKGGKWIIKK